ncbi:MAG: Hsp20/alpha crystallin family protein [Longimonas sp.]|uniref:Hsp20/alpha crystallin family protein n=1 Tax=Longimonas sp. TaxID=2039626 RepID=UPI0033648867
MTNLTRTPNRSLRTLQNEIDQVFNRLFPTSEGNGDRSESTARMWAPRTDMVETADNYEIHLDLPGMSKDDLKINMQERQLTVSGERRHEARNEDDEFVRVERAFGHFHRSFTLPQSIQEDNIEAAYEDGVLKITVPKAEESKPRQISIQ